MIDMNVAIYADHYLFLCGYKLYIRNYLLWNGIEHLDGIASTDSEWVKFGQAYFFSAQTFTTVGYGHISPVGFLTSALSAAEALLVY
jgi:inward rectifier potassium channel